MLTAIVAVALAGVLGLWSTSQGEGGKELTRQLENERQLMAEAERKADADAVTIAEFQKQIAKVRFSN